MATIIQKNKDLINRYEENSKKKSIGYTISLISFLVIVLSFTLGMLFMRIPIILLIISVFSMVISLVVAEYYRSQAVSLERGIDGENTTASIISALPNDYYGFQNLIVSFDGKKSELDMVVVGKTGVFIVETKNYKGSIYGNYESHQWIQHKMGRGGTPYSKEFYSPVKQVGTHIYRLANHLRQYGVRVYVNGLVYFADPDTSVFVDGDNGGVPVFSADRNNPYEILYHITNVPEQLTEEEVLQICNILNR